MAQVKQCKREKFGRKVVCGYLSVNENEVQNAGCKLHTNLPGSRLVILGLGCSNDAHHLFQDIHHGIQIQLDCLWPRACNMHIPRCCAETTGVSEPG